jgi:hypothetical protein
MQKQAFLFSKYFQNFPGGILIQMEKLSFGEEVLFPNIFRIKNLGIKLHLNLV